MTLQIEVSCQAKDARRLNDADRWHFRSFDVWELTLRLDVEDSVLKQFMTRKVLRRFKNIDGLHKSLLAENVQPPNTLQKGIMWWRPSCDTRARNIAQYFKELLANEGACKSLLLKAFFHPNSSLLDVALSNPRNSKDDLGNSGAAGMELISEHHETPDFVQWISNHLQTSTLQEYLEATKREQSQRLSAVQGRVTAELQHGDWRGSEEKQYQLRLQKAAQRREQLGAHSDALKAQCNLEEKRLEAQQAVSYLLLFPGTCVEDVMSSSVRATRDTGGSAQRKKLLRLKADFEAEGQELQLFEEKLRNYLGEIPGRQQLLHLEQSASHEALKRATCEPVNGMKQGHQTLIQLRLDIDSSARGAIQTCEQETSLLENNKSAAEAWLASLKETRESYLVEKATWDDILSCLDAESAATSLELARVASKVEVIYRPLRSHAEIAKNSEIAIDGVQDRCEKRNLLYTSMLQEAEGQGDCIAHENTSSQHRAEKWDNCTISAHTAYMAQWESWAILPPTRPPPKELLHAWTAALDRQQLRLEKVESAEQAIEISRNKVEEDSQLLEKAEAFWDHAEDPQSWQLEQKGAADLLGGLTSSEAVAFWTALNAEASRAQCRREALESRWEVAAEHLDDEGPVQEQVLEVCEALQADLDVLQETLDFETGARQKLMETLEQHEGVRLQRVNSLQQEIENQMKWASGELMAFQKDAQFLETLSQQLSTAEAQLKKCKASLQSMLTQYASCMKAPRPPQVSPSTPLQQQLQIWNRSAQAFSDAAAKCFSAMKVLNDASRSCDRRAEEGRSRLHQLDSRIPALQKAKEGLMIGREDRPVMMEFFYGVRLQNDKRDGMLRPAMDRRDHLRNIVAECERFGAGAVEMACKLQLAQQRHINEERNLRQSLADPRFAELSANGKRNQDMHSTCVSRAEAVKNEMQRRVWEQQREAVRQRQLQQDHQRQLQHGAEQLALQRAAQRQNLDYQRAAQHQNLVYQDARYQEELDYESERLGMRQAYEDNANYQALAYEDARCSQALAYEDARCSQALDYENERLSIYEDDANYYAYNQRPRQLALDDSDAW